MSGIGNRHGQSLTRRHGEECRVHPDPLRHPEGDVGKAEQRPRAKGAGTPLHRFQGLQGRLRIRRDRHHQPVHNEIVFRETMDSRPRENISDDLLASLRRFRDLPFRQGQENEHGTVFRGQGQEFPHFFIFARDGVQECPSRIPPQGRFDRLDLRRIYDQGELGHRREEIDHGHDRLNLVDSGNAHIDVQKIRPFPFLVTGHLPDERKLPFPEVLLQGFPQGLLSRGVDPLPDDFEGFIPVQKDRFPGRCQGGDGFFQGSDRPCGPQFPLQECNVFRRRPAAASEQIHSGGYKIFREPAELACAHSEDGFSVHEYGDSRVRLRHEGDLRVRLHGRDEPHHVFRARGAVASHGVCAQTLEGDERRHGVRPVQGAAVPFKGHGDDGEDFRLFAGGDEGGPGLLNVHHGLYHQEIGAPRKKAFYLLFENTDSFFEIQISEGLDETAGGADIARNEGPGSHCFFRDEREPPVHVSHVGDPVLRELQAVRSKGGCVNDVGARLLIPGMDGPDHLRVFDAPCLRAHPRGHSHLLEFRPHGAVKHQNPLLQAFDDLRFPGHRLTSFFMCHLCFSLLFHSFNPRQGRHRFLRRQDEGLRKFHAQAPEIQCIIDPLLIFEKEVTVARRESPLG